MGLAVILLTFVTLLLVLAGAVYDLRQTEKIIHDRRRGLPSEHEPKPAVY